MKNKISAVILAGGKSSRINRDKTLLRLGDSLLLEKIISLLQDLFTEIIIVSANKQIYRKFSEYKIISDEFENCGPLGGIHAALGNAEGKAIFVFACDMPNLNPKIIQRQLQVFEKEKVDAVVPSHIEGIEPLHAIYAKSCLPAIENQLKQNNKSVRSFFSKIKIKYLEFLPSEIKFFFNINTEHDLKSIQNQI